MNAFPPITHSSIVRASRDQVSADLSGETAILNLSDGTYYGLNEAGTLIWKLLQAPVSVSAIRDAIVAEYEVSAEEAETDLLAVIHELLDRKLIEVE